eukprot:PhF_6_TR36000/c0_g1_i2/m.52163
MNERFLGYESSVESVTFVIHGNNIERSTFEKSLSGQCVSILEDKIVGVESLSSHDIIASATNLKVLTDRVTLPVEWIQKLMKKSWAFPVCYAGFILGLSLAVAVHRAGDMATACLVLGYTCMFFSGGLMVATFKREILLLLFKGVEFWLLTSHIIFFNVAECAIAHIVHHIPLSMIAVMVTPAAFVVAVFGFGMDASPLSLRTRGIIILSFAGVAFWNMIAMNSIALKYVQTETTRNAVTTNVSVGVFSTTLQGVILSNAWTVLVFSAKQAFKALWNKQEYVVIRSRLKTLDIAHAWPSSADQPSTIVSLTLLSWNKTDPNWLQTWLSEIGGIKLDYSSIPIPQTSRVVIIAPTKSIRVVEKVPVINSENAQRFLACRTMNVCSLFACLCAVGLFLNAHRVETISIYMISGILSLACTVQIFRYNRARLRMILRTVEFWFLSLALTLLVFAYSFLSIVRNPQGTVPILIVSSISAPLFCVFLFGMDASPYSTKVRGGMMVGYAMVCLFTMLGMESFILPHIESNETIDHVTRTYNFETLHATIQSVVLTNVWTILVFGSKFAFKTLIQKEEYVVLKGVVKNIVVEPTFPAEERSLVEITPETDSS